MHRAGRMMPVWNVRSRGTDRRLVRKSSGPEVSRLLLPDKRNRRSIERSGQAQRAASNRGQLNENAQSNQQDLIGEMEADGQQKTPRSPEFLVRADCRARKIGKVQCGEGCPELLTV